ncbi:hypothetical protein [Lautropia mirabilis]|jgi:hypothetical protein|uniref:Uncharacterized protein n=1 Tax=Lautropia mirabilis ATCC 51599 TaxID=887898 RepID=E7RYB2_9BURK|nr:hypothetical protein [Lautropia mirabilis]EFV94611.1 hypothetical protein HMPREF0551_1676 [Lautropia mirabilis ATCC 51599]VEH00840.1 Uncharacterised protein [Lautropia mirabilis]
MATQNRTTKPQPTQGSAAARQAAQAPAADAAKMAKQAADKAELDKMAQAKQAEAVKEVVAETTAEGSVATADAAAAAEGSLGAVSGEAAVAEAGAAGAAGTAAAISPLAIGAGVVGVVAVAAAAGGGSSGGSSSQPIAQNNNQQAAQNQGSQKPATPAAEQPAQDTKPAEGTNKPAEGAKPTEPAKEEEPAKQADSKPADQPKVDPTPVEDLTKPATAAGTAAEPKVAADGVTNLTKFADLFETAGANGGKAEYIKISRILSAENAKDAEARAVDSDNSRAYEVIDAGKPITLAEAQTMAAKLGGKLMSIDTAEEKAWLDKNLFGALGEYDGDKSLAEAAARGESDKAAQQKVLDGQLASNGAWLGKNATEGADAKANAVIRNGNNADGSGAMKLYEAAGTTLSKFVIEYEGYKSPLLLDGKPVVEGQIINKADAAKLAWNADLNKAGKITYQAVDSNDAATAKPVADAKEGTMALSESADVKHPMTTPANPSAQDKPAQGGTEVKPANDVPQADKTGQDTQNSDQQPAKQELPATAQGTAEAPQVAANGETKLANVATAFEKAAGEGKNVEFIKIVRVDTSEGEAGTRIFREVETTSKVTGKAPDAPAPVKTVSTTAYEVISTKEPITRAQAEEMAKVRGGKLLTIDSAEEAQFIGQKLFGSLGEYDSDESVAEAKGDTAKAAQQDVLNGQLAKNGAWLGKDSTAGAVANADAIIRNGNGTDLPKGYKAYDFSGEKLSRFVIEIENYKAPLTLEGKPVVDGTIINKADFDKLVWNGDHNMGGKITYVAVQSNEANAAKVEGAEEKTLTVSESATITHPSAPASNPAQNQQQGGAGTPEVQDNKAPTGGEGPKGDQKAGEGSNKAGDPPKGGEHGTDGGNHKADTPQNSTTGSDANKGNGNPGGQGAAAGGSTGGAGAQGGSKPQEGGSDSKAGGTTQDAGSQSQGQTPPSKPAGSDPQAGSPSGKPVAPGGQPSDAPSQPAGTPEAQTGGAVNQPAQPPVKAAPSYEANKSVNVAHDETNAKIGKEVFEGTNSANKPEAVKATGFAAGALKVDGNVITDGALIKAADFDKVTWDASKGEGGTFKFTPVQANGDALQGATEQTITINEAPAPVVNAEPKLGVYPTEAVKFDVAHDALKGALTKDSQTSPFAGTDAEKAPDAVKIVSVQGPDGENTHANIMTLGDGGSARNLTAGQFIDKADFSKVQWDASVDHGSGTYKVQFVPVTSDHQEIAGAQTQTFTVKEAAEQPNYSGTTFSAEAEHNGDATFGKAMFDGSDAAKAPMFIRITEISPSNAEAGDHRVLHLVGDHAQDLKVDDSHPENTVLSAAQFENLRWDASHNGGGSFKFTALDGDMKPIDSSVVHTVTVTEKDAPLAINPQSLFGASEGQGPLTISAKSLAAYTPAEPSSNLLDDLHNQINPLI